MHATHFPIVKSVIKELGRRVSIRSFFSGSPSDLLLMGLMDPSTNRWIRILEDGM